MNRSLKPNREPQEGFTLLDLLVAVVVTSILIVLALPAIAVSKGQTRLAVCAGNLREITLANQIYANENRNLLPTIPSGGAWAWDLPWSAAPGLLQAGLVKSTFYCPGTAPRFTDTQNWQDQSAPYRNLWDFGANRWPPQTATGGFHTVGYCFAYAGVGSMVTVSNQNTTMLPESIKNGAVVMPAPAPAARVLVADANLSSSSALPGNAHPENNYTRVQGGFYQPHLCPHLNGDVPAGGNVGFKDGHVEWRPFQLMVPRTSGGGVPFWW
jgi:type II secretory pathway pseudopilin PulG